MELSLIIFGISLGVVIMAAIYGKSHVEFSINQLAEKKYYFCVSRVFFVVF